MTPPPPRGTLSPFFTVFFISGLPLPQLLWSALTKLDGGGEENGVEVLYQMELHVYVLINY